VWAAVVCFSVVAQAFNISTAANRQASRLFVKTQPSENPKIVGPGPPSALAENSC